MTTEEFNAWKWEQERLEGAYRAQTDAFRPSHSTNKQQSASSMRDKEVTWQYRTKANYDGYGWSRWINCSKEFYEHREKTPLRNGFCYELRKVHGRGTIT